ncbi:MAG: PorT family protein [Paludibacteraceae bacterium]|nr:PorT family protein [Paludibacteraceae bacterium]
MLKKLAISLIVLLGWANTATSQVRSRFEEEIGVGVQGGLALSQVRFLHNDVTYSNNLGDLGYRKGADFGAMVRFIAQKHFGLQLEANYTQSGWKEKWNDPTTINEQQMVDGTIEREIDYLNVPLLAHIYFGNTHRMFFNFGPKIGFLLGTGDNKTNLTPEQQQAILTNNWNDPRLNETIEENKVDLGLCVGAGYEFHLSKVNILAEARWHWGLKDVFEHDRSAVFQRSNNQLFTFTLGVMMPVIKFHSN